MKTFNYVKKLNAVSLKNVFRNHVILSYAYTSTYMQNHNDTIIKQTSKDFLRKNIYTSPLFEGSKRVTGDFTVRGSWRPNRTAIY